MFIARTSLIVYLLLPSLALAQTTINLGDLNIASSRVPQWYPATTAEASYASAQSWPEYDVTCECVNDACVADTLGVASCAPASGKIAFFNSWGCSEANPADDGGEDWQQIGCIANAVPTDSVVYIPDGTYDMGNLGQEIIKVNRGNVVLRGQSNTGTHLQAVNELLGNAVFGWANCSGGQIDCSSAVISFGTGYTGTSTAWIAGYEEDTKSITVTSTAGFSTPGWVMLEMPCAALEPNPIGGTTARMEHIARITSIDGSVLTIDHGLRMDYDDDGCEGAATAEPYSPITSIGIENLHLTSDSTLTQANIGNARGGFGWGGVAESWAVGNVINRFADESLRIRYSARNWIQGNEISNMCTGSGTFNTEGVYLSQGASENVIENNHGTDFCVWNKQDVGPEGTVIAYNYLPGGTPYRTGTEKTMFNHGQYTREILQEGNDTDAAIYMGDAFWGDNGPRNTAYRNRITGSHIENSSLVINHDGIGAWNVGSYFNMIGNTAYSYLSLAGGGIANNWDNPQDLDADTTFGWLERNMFRLTSTCTADPGTCSGGTMDGQWCDFNTPVCSGGGTCITAGSNRCGFHMDEPEATTSCGTAQGDCLAGSADNGILGNNYGGDSAQGVIATDTAIPASLYRTEAPSWWCQEACDWAALTGIGAWGDDFGVALCKLPAQIAAEAGTCTALVAGPKSVSGLGLSGVSRGQQ